MKWLQNRSAGPCWTASWSRFSPSRRQANAKHRIIRRIFDSLRFETRLWTIKITSISPLIFSHKSAWKQLTNEPSINYILNLPINSKSDEAISSLTRRTVGSRIIAQTALTRQMTGVDHLLVYRRQIDKCRRDW